MLSMDPNKRITAQDALNHEYFRTAPFAAPCATLHSDHPALVYVYPYTPTIETLKQMKQAREKQQQTQTQTQTQQQQQQQQQQTQEGAPSAIQEKHVR